MLNALLNHTWLGHSYDDWYRQTLLQINNKMPQQYSLTIQTSQPTQTKTASQALHKAGIYDRAAIWKRYASKANAHPLKEAHLKK